MRIALLGPLLVEGDDGAGVDVLGPRLRALLVRLAFDTGSFVSPGALIDALWAGEAPSDAGNALQSLVSRLRRALPAGVVESGPAGYRLSILADDVDGALFERLSREGHHLLRDGDAARAAAILGEALSLWRGPVAMELAGTPFVESAAARLEELRLQATTDRVEADLLLGRHAALLVELGALVELHPLNEAIAAQHLRALAGAGRPSDALTAYERTRRILADELGVDPSPALQEVHLAILRGDQSLMPARRTARRATNLRSALTTFVGRDDDVARIATVLARARLVTLVGPGGAGKTRLASEVVAAMLDAFGNAALDASLDAAWIVELAPVTAGSEIAQAALSALELRDNLLPESRQGGPRDAVSRLVGSLADLDALIVLDNCEHVITDAAVFAEELLTRCPRLRILATSREPLGIAGESLVPVVPLRHPAGPAAVAEAVTYPAVLLFADRAAAVCSGFVIDDTTVGAVVSICRSLDGLPLAIELAAARLRTLSVQQVAERLSDRFQLLTGGSRTAMARHQTLRAVVSWSWDLLTEEERWLAERLAIFPGGVTPDSALAVAAEGTTSVAALDVLSALADKSLLQVMDAGEPRFRMLETIREYGTECLVARGSSADVRDRHARYFLDVTETIEPLLRGPDQLMVMETLIAEVDNVSAALRHSSAVGDIDTATRLMAAMSWFFALRGRHTEASAWLRLVLDLPGDPPPGARATAIVLHCMSAFAAGDGLVSLDDVRRLLEVEVPGIDGTRGHPAHAIAGPALAMVTEDAEMLRTHIDRNLAHPDPWTRALLMFLRAAFAENVGNAEEFRSSLAAATEQFRVIGDRWGRAVTLSMVGGLRLTDGDVDGAIAAYEEAMGLVAELGAVDDVGEVLLRLAMAHTRNGHFPEAQEAAERARQYAQDRGATGMVGYADLSLAEIARLRGDSDSARGHAEAALAAMSMASFGPLQVRALCHVTLAYLDLDTRAHGAARERLREAAQLAVASYDMPVAACVAVGRAELALSEGEPALAAQLLGVSVALRGMPDVGNPDVRRIAAASAAVLAPEVYEHCYAEGAGLDRSGALGVLVG